MINNGVLAFLTQPSVTALVGTRIIPDMAKKGTLYPRLVFFKVSTDRQTLLGGVVGVASARFQLDCWGLTRASASTVGDAVRQAVQTWQKDATRPNWGDQVVQSVSIADEGDDYEPPQDSSDVGAYRARLDLSIWYQE